MIQKLLSDDAKELISCLEVGAYKACMILCGSILEVKEGQRILGNGNLYIIELDEEKADPYYLAAFFGSEQGTAALRSITVGATIPNIGVEQLTKLVIPIPPIEKQKEIADKYKTVKDEIIMLQLKLEKAKNRMAHIIEEGGI